jgi:hypothetical protein
VPKNPLTLSRQELYDLVWSKPMVQLATELGLSDVGLAKRCRAVSVPVPPRGYWARKASGQEPDRPPLRKYRTAISQEESVAPAPKPPVTPRAAPTFSGPEPVVIFTPKMPDGRPNFRLPQDDFWLAERRTYDADLAHAIVFEERPDRWHKGLIAQRDSLRKAAKDLESSRKDHLRYESLPPHRQRLVDWGRNGSEWRRALHDGQRLLDYHKPRPFRVSTASLERALGITNALALAVQARSFTLDDDLSIGRLVIRGHGGEAAMRITERLEEVIEKVKRYDGKYEAEKRRVPTGVLKLSLDKSYGSTIDFSDTPARSIEDQLPRVLEAIYILVIRCRVKNREREYDREQKRVADEARARAAEIRRQEERKRTLEAQRQRTLFRQARRWERAAILRAYIGHIDEQLFQCTSDAKERLGNWRVWALDVASEIDPTARVVAALVGGTDPASSENG